MQEAQGNNLTHEEFLELILQDEMHVRHERLMQRHLKVASFREQKTLDDFDWRFNAPSSASRSATSPPAISSANATMSS